MAIRESSGLRNFLQEGGSFKRAFANGRLCVYSLAQPASADAAVVGVLLCTYTKSSGAHVPEVLPKGVVTLGQTGAGTGSVDTFVVNGIDILGGAVASLATVDLTAAKVVEQINDNPANFQFKASNVAGVITLTGIPGIGATHNAKTLACGVTAGTNTVTSAITSTTFGSATGGGVEGVTALNGLRFGDSAAGKLVKDPNQIWSGTAVADGTAGSFRLYGSVADAGAVDAAEQYIRMDGSIATSGGNLNLSSTNYVTGAPMLQNTFNVTEPAGS